MFLKKLGGNTEEVKEKMLYSVSLTLDVEVGKGLAKTVTIWTPSKTSKVVQNII